ncbi:MAG: Rieske 2Fe-2S domain-containing protein [Burkholderiaceae bacterium]|nr:Rieske 2Fe-2S domain-containing protein [Burkholderiaceae bacterium]
MSDALNYLLAARPEALTHYFKFLKDAGKHLDPKTRNLISVITKVDAQTERGFKQYLGRALREGCSPAEVLDALLMAFPTLGLAKIIWAVDIILSMNLPGFNPEAMRVQLAGAESDAEETPSAAVAASEAEVTWHDVLTTAALADGQTTRVDSHGRGLFISREGDGYSAFDSHCTHQGTDIPLSALNDCTLTCPKHQWTFDVKTGACLKAGGNPLQQYPAMVVGGRVMVQW